MNHSIRLTVVMTHPVQYDAPWFRYIAGQCPEIALTVLYAIEPTPAQQGVGFGAEVQWDVPLTDGYRCRVVRPARPADIIRSGSFWGLDVPEIGRAIRESEPDVALVPGWHSVTLARALWACRRNRIPVLYRGDTHLGAGPTGWRRPLWTARTWFLLRLFDGYLSVGRQAGAYFRRFGVRASRVFEAPHAVDNDFFARGAAPHRDPSARRAARLSWGLGTQDFVVLFVGKLAPQKRPLDLVQAMAHLEPGAALLVVGAGELEHSARAEAARLRQRVGWAGFLNQSELGRAYAASDCLALPSAGETWGLVVNEALATGLPCVVSDRVGCAPDLIVPGETGEIFRMGNVLDLAAALGRVRARGAGSHDWAPACIARAGVHSFARATSGLLEACRAVDRRRLWPGVVGDAAAAPRVVACCGGMVIVAGLERMTFEVLRVLRERGATVHCIVNSWENHRVVALAEGIGASWSAGYYWYPFERRARNPIRLAQLAWDILCTSAGLMRASARVRATHVLVPEFVSVLRNAPALALLRLLGVRVILRVGNAPDPGTFYRRLWRWAVNPLVHRFVCNSRFTKRELLAHGIPPSKVSLIYNCPPRREPVATAGVDRDAGRVIYVGQIIPPKGVGILLDAIGLLAERGEDVRLDVVGDIEGWEPPAWEGYHRRLVARAKLPDLADRVRFLGLREDVPALLASAGIHCCPSLPELREGFGVVNVEAKAAGVPSVVFPTGALPELISHGEDGWVCREPSAEALAEGIAYFLSDFERRERVGAAALAKLSRLDSEFSPAIFAERWWSVFREG